MDSLYPFSQSNSILIHTGSTQPWLYGVTLCVEPAYFVSGVLSAFPLASFPQHSAIKVIYVEVWIRAFFKRLSRCIVFRYHIKTTLLQGLSCCLFSAVGVLFCEHCILAHGVFTVTSLSPLHAIEEGLCKVGNTRTDTP